MSKELTCEICHKPAIGVASSSLGPISHAYCRECVNAGREVWTTLIGGLMTLDPVRVAERMRPIIEATCKFYNRTEEQLWDEVKKLETDYEAHRASQLKESES